MRLLTCLALRLQDIKSMSTQLAHVYNVNRNAVGPVDIIMTPLNGQLRERLDALNNQDYLRWKRIRTLDVPIQALWSQPLDSKDHQVAEGTSASASDNAGAQVDDRSGSTEASTSALASDGTSEPSLTEGRGERPIPRVDQNSVMYLTADSENTLTELEEGKTYIIGGIVDHNQYKVGLAFIAKRVYIHGDEGLTIVLYVRISVSASRRSRRSSTPRSRSASMWRWPREKC